VLCADDCSMSTARRDVAHATNSQNVHRSKYCLPGRIQRWQTSEVGGPVPTQRSSVVAPYKRSKFRATHFSTSRSWSHGYDCLSIQSQGIVQQAFSCDMIYHLLRSSDIQIAIYCSISNKQTQNYRQALTYVTQCDRSIDVSETDTVILSLPAV
jgi:hypothetical protein